MKIIIIIIQNNNSNLFAFVHALPAHFSQFQLVACFDLLKFQLYLIIHPQIVVNLFVSLQVGLIVACYFVCLRNATNKCGQFLRPEVSVLTKNFTFLFFTVNLINLVQLLIIFCWFILLFFHSLFLPSVDKKGNLAFIPWEESRHRELDWCEVPECR